MDKYAEIYEKSRNDHKAKKRKIVTVDLKQFTKASATVAAIIVSVSIALPATVNFFGTQHTKTEMAIMAASELTNAGYNNYIDDSRYHLLDDIDLFDLYLVIPDERFNEVLNYRGYQSLEDFFAKNNYENFEDWKNDSISDYKEEKKR